MDIELYLLKGAFFSDFATIEGGGQGYHVLMYVKGVYYFLSVNTFMTAVF